MAKFDLQTSEALRIATSIGQGQDILGALDVEYGIPSCVMNLGSDLLSLLPTNVLGGIRNNMSIGRNAADAVTKALSQKLRNLTGIIEFDTDQGVFRFVSDASQYGQEVGGLAGDIAGFVGLAQQAIAFGSRLYSNVEAGVASINELIDCVGDYASFLKNSAGESGDARADQARGNPEAFANLIKNEYGPQIEASNNAKKFIEKANKTISDIDKIITDRVQNPNLIPRLAEVASPSATGSVFRLNAGPPESKSGQFLLSVDGLYFDSQTSGIGPALIELDTRSKSKDPSLDWTFEFEPNLGGKGVPVNEEQLDAYFETIFDF